MAGEARASTGGTTSVDDGGSTAERILAAALDAFAERGIDATSLDAVAAEVGVRKQTLLYWFPSKEKLLLGVIDRAVEEMGAILSVAARSPRRRARSGSAGPEEDRLVSVVDAVFRLGSTRPQLLALLREVVRHGPPASTHLATAIEPLISTAVASVGRQGQDSGATRTALLRAGARVVGLVTEAELLDDLGIGADRAWLRARRRALLADLHSALL